jgi:deoxyribodipyrimidine photo-lyase
MQILYHFPNVETESFNPAYRKIEWINDEVNIKKWVPEYGTSDYPEPIIVHKMARERALSVFSKSINK